jgi:nucleotide-binding universal stress UspA family protein
MMKILLPVDGSEASLDAVRYAIVLARSGLEARFVLANVQAPNTLYEMMVAHDAEVLERISYEAGEHLLQPARSLLDEAGLASESQIGSGEPGPMLLDLIEEQGCEAVVMGARGMGGVRAAVLGSVSEWLLHHSAVPVTIVPHVEADAVEEDAGDSEEPGDAAEG